MNISLRDGDENRHGYLSFEADQYPEQIKSLSSSDIRESSCLFDYLSKEENFLRIDFKNKKRKLTRLYKYSDSCLAYRNKLQNLTVSIKNALNKKYSPPFDIIYHHLNI